MYSPQGRVVGLRDIGAGGTFGEFAAIDGAPRSAGIEAKKYLGFLARLVQANQRRNNQFKDG